MGKEVEERNCDSTNLSDSYGLPLTVASDISIGNGGEGDESLWKRFTG